MGLLSWLCPDSEEKPLVQGRDTPNVAGAQRKETPVQMEEMIEVRLSWEPASPKKVWLVIRRTETSSFSFSAVVEEVVSVHDTEEQADTVLEYQNSRERGSSYKTVKYYKKCLILNESPEQRQARIVRRERAREQAIREAEQKFDAEWPEESCC